MLNPLLALSADATEVLPEFTLGRVLTDWGIDPIPFVVTVWAVGLYALGVATLLFVVPVALGTLHQATAVLVLTAALVALHALRPTRGT